ncbi:MAG: phage portal protein [Phycisphaeraceae bacterium]|nr:phage portal protein [Phycisphaeraceae bacterium]
MSVRIDDVSGIEGGAIAALIEEHESLVRPRLEMLWRYYRNPMDATGGAAGAGAGRRLAQRAGLPPRLVGRTPGDDDRAGDREVVIENDIAWRIHTMVDFMFGKPVRILSTARDEATRERVERILDAVWEASGGVAMLQDFALLGHVYGHADLALRLDEAGLRLLGRRGTPADAGEISEHVRIEPVEPTRGVPVLNPDDYRRLDAYAVHFERELNEVERTRGVGVFGRGRGAPARRRRSIVTEVITGEARRVYEDGDVVEESAITLTGGRVPVVHVQNVSQPFRYSGLSEVEPLIPLQDELNTRLSDRASRVTLQSFKMYLAKGIDGFERMPVGPGRVWSTDNPQASVEAFGGDASSPSEEAHVKEVRDALDKTSGVPPLATGVVQGRVGNLSSANALKITLVGLLGKTERKRVTYGRGIAEVCAIVLGALDASGVIDLDERDRGVRLEWPDPLPSDVLDETLAAKRKVELGVPAERVLDELGYLPSDAGVV